MHACVRSPHSYVSTYAQLEFIVYGLYHFGDSSKLEKATYRGIICYLEAIQYEGTALQMPYKKAVQNSPISLKVLCSFDL
jgi:hypothetical protein